MRLRRSTAALALITLTGLWLSACGGSDDEPSTGGSQSSAPGETAPADPASEDTGGGTTAASFADCSAITADEMGAVLGQGTGTAEVPPGGGSCTYALDDPELPSVSIEQFTTADVAGGWEEYRAQINNTAIGAIDATPEPVDGVGDGAELVVGPSVSGGESLMSIGVVLLGDTIVRATVLQAADLDEAAMSTLTTDILTLVASKA